MAVGLEEADVRPGRLASCDPRRIVVGFPRSCDGLPARVGGRGQAACSAGTKGCYPTQQIGYAYILLKQSGLRNPNYAAIRIDSSSANLPAVF